VTRAHLTIAHVADSLEVGGAEIMMATLARTHRVEGHRVSVHCLYAEGALAAELRREGIEVFVHCPGSPGARARRLFQALRACRPDVVHCHNAAATIYGATAARLCSVPAILSTRHSLADRNLFRQELKFWIAARLFCRQVVVVSEAVERSVGSHGLADRSKLQLIRNGAAALSSVNSGNERARGLVLVNVARLTRLKDQMTLLRASLIARKTVSDLEVVIVGDGDQGEKLRAFARENGMTDWVQFAGERKDVGDFLARAHVFVLSSISEGLPISLLEAMAAGLPAISTHVGGIPEVARMSGACELVPPSDPEAMAGAIRRHAVDRDQLADLGLRARRCYEQWFSPERMARDYMNLYRGCKPASPAEATPGQLAAKEGCR
jgi:glycosyltransferase involved in cell wall biosynthesis